MTLTRGPERMVAMVVQSAGLAPREAARLRDYGYDPSIYRMAVTDDQAQGQKFFTYRFPLTFKESANLSRNVYFSNYFLWIGKVRELAMWPIFERLAHQCASGEWGMVTNHSQTKILAEAKLNDVIEGHLWLGNVSGTTGSTLDLHYDWYRVLPNDELELLALSELRTTWVRIVDHGVVEAQPFPDYFQEFVNERLTRYNPPEELQPLIEADLGSELYRAPTGPLAASRLAKQVFETTLEDANLVGNIYFSNYAVWQGRVRDRFLYQLVPNLYHGMNTQGELLCRTSRIEHLREAMPFDNIEVTMSPRTVHEHGVRLFFEYFRLTPDNARQKLAFGEHDAVWMKRGTGDRLVPAPLPREILDAISPTSELPTTYAAGQNGPRQNPNAFRRFFRRFGQKASTD
jgi:enediyne polyketide synthase